MGASVFHWIGDHDSCERLLDMLVKHAGEHGLATYLAAGNALKGRAIVLSGNAEEGIRIMRDLLIHLHRDGYELYSVELHCILAEELAKSGRLKESLEIVNAEIESVNRNGHFVSLPELLRIRGQLSQRVGNEREAEKVLS